MKNELSCALLWAVGLGAPGDSVNLAAGSSHPKGDGQLLADSCSWGLWTLPACSVTQAAQSKPLVKDSQVLIVESLAGSMQQLPEGKMRTGEERSGGTRTRAPVRGEDQPPGEAWWGQEARCRAGWRPLHSSPDLAFVPSTPGVLQCGWERVGRYLKWECLNFLWCYVYPRFMGHLYQFHKFIWKQVFYSILFPFLF